MSWRVRMISPGIGAAHLICRLGSTTNTRIDLGKTEKPARAEEPREEAWTKAEALGRRVGACQQRSTGRVSQSYPVSSRNSAQAERIIEVEFEDGQRPTTGYLRSRWLDSRVVFTAFSRTDLSGLRDSVANGVTCQLPEPDTSCAVLTRRPMRSSAIRMAAT